MADSLLTSPAFILSAIATVGLGGYSYLYLPFQMRKAYRQSLLTLARAVETKDLSTEGLGERVARYTVAVARAIRVPAKERRKMEYAAFLQGIGNLKIPSAILNKPGPLTDEEVEIAKTHVEVGADMVQRVEFLKDIAPIIRAHHEAWDGSGYPQGLKGKDIPLGARILAVCSAYDAMTHDRPYRPALDEETAVREIRALSGSKFDPEVVDAFLKVIKNRHHMRENTL